MAYGIPPRTAVGPEEPLPHGQRHGHIAGGDMADVNADRFPRAAAYLASLPNGMDSHPDCTVRMDATAAVMKEFPDLLSAGASPKFRTALENAVKTPSLYAPDCW